MSVKIFHCADIHLDAPFSGVSAAESEKRRNELRSAFTSAVMYAKAASMDVFLISGDLFDSDYVTRDSAELICSQINSCPECHFFISPGNHDPFTANSIYAGLRLPENAHVFSAQREKIYIPSLNLNVFGVGFTSTELLSSPVTGYPPADPDRINILVCHGDVGNPSSSNGPVSKKEIAESGFDYIAFGHVHKPSGLLREGETAYCYPGCLEGRSFDEPGVHGAMAGIIDRGSVNMKFVPFSRRRYEELKVDISNIESKADAIETIKSKISAFGPETILRLTLSGEIPDGFVFSSSELKNQDGAPGHIIIKDKTVPRLSLTSLENDTSLRGVFYNRVNKLISGCKPDSEEYQTAVLALKYGISALGDRDFMDFSGDDEND